MSSKIKFPTAVWLISEWDGIGKIEKGKKSKFIFRFCDYYKKLLYTSHTFDCIQHLKNIKYLSKRED
jgi:hypothetical protein